MTVHESGERFGNRYIATVHRGAISVAFVSGTLALVAMLVGTPLQIGSALAVCATGWIVAHIAEQLATEESASLTRLRARRPAILTAHGHYVRSGQSLQRVRYPESRFRPVSAA